MGRSLLVLDAADPAVLAGDCGPKAQRLAELTASGVPVPPWICISPDALRAVVDADPVLSAHAEHFRLSSISKVDVLGAGRRLERTLRETAVPASLVTAVTDAMRDRGVEWPLAVRSSGSLEDRTAVELTGAYSSVLSVDGEAQLATALRTVWASLYSSRALLRFADSSEDVDGEVVDLSKTAMAVIVQHQVLGEWSGVALTVDPVTQSRATVVVEAAPGVGGVVGGDTGSCRVVFLRERPGVPISVDGTEELELPTDVAAAVFAASLAVEQAVGTPQEVEWCFGAGRTWIVQSRDVEQATETPIAECAQVIVAHNPEAALGFEFADCLGIFRSQERKQLPLRRFAADAGIRTPTMVWARAVNEPSPYTQLSKLLPDFESSVVQVDLSTNLRGIGCPTADLSPFLASLAAAHPRSAVSAFLRDMIPSDFGAISTALPNAGVRIEYVAGAMQGIRGGSARASVVLVDDDDHYTIERVSQGAMEVVDLIEMRIVRKPFAGKPSSLPAEAVAEIAEWTRVLDRWQPGIGAEWFVWESRAYLSDITLDVNTAGLGSSEISPGDTEGVVVRVSEDDLLGEVASGWAISVDSENPAARREGLERLRKRKPWLPEGGWVVVADRPFIELALLAPFANGFVFETGSLLSHLSVMLRRRGLPAVVAPAAASFTDGMLIRIDSGIVEATSAD